MSRIFVDRISPYQSGSLVIDGYDPSIDTGSLVTTASFNAYTASNDGKVNNLISATGSYANLFTFNVFENDQVITGSVTINGNQTITGSTTLTGVANFGDDIKQSTGVSGNAAYIQNPNYFSQFYGSTLVWRPNFSGGRTILDLNEKSLVRLQLNAWTSSYDNVTGIKSTSAGAEFFDWILPSYTEDTWLAVPQQGNPSFKRTVEITGSVEVSEVLQLTGLDPLPAGAVGQLAVSGSNLYFHDGSTWIQK